MRVSGSSMLPAIRPGDVITVRRCGHEGASPGEVVLFCREGRFFAHRVVARAGEALITRGDAIAVPDAPVLPDELLGKVVATERGGRPLGARPTGLERLAAGVFRRCALAGRLFARTSALLTRGGA